MITYLPACSSTSNRDFDAIPLDIGDYSSLFHLDEIVPGTYLEPVVPDKETACKIAQAIFDGIPKYGEEQKFTLQNVFYDAEDEIWIVSFWEDWDDSGEITMGYDCSIAIQKSDGKVVKIWFGE